MKRSRRQSGFTLIETLVAIGIFLIIIGIAFSAFNDVLRTAKQEGIKAQSQIQGIVGLEVLRQDVQQAGFGLPWSYATKPAYSEAASAPASLYNDSSSADMIPRPIIGVSSLTSYSGRLNGADYLVIKSSVIGSDDACQKWGYVNKAADGSTVLHTWNDASFTANDNVIVILPVGGKAKFRQMVTGSQFYTPYSSPLSSSYSPYDFMETYSIYGISTTAKPRMPFNRADYFVATASVPKRCAPNTGVLVKAVVSHADGSLLTPMPILDCVADFKVVFGLDTNNDGIVDTYVQDLTVPLGGVTMTASQIRQQVKEVRVYVLSQEGQKDRTYSNPTQKLKYVTDVTDTLFGEALAVTYDLAAKIGSGWEHYRWKVYEMSITPKNLY